MPTATFVLQDELGRILMELRHSPKEYKGKWLLPGGKVEDGESPEEAMIREAYEETGIVVRSYTKIVTDKPLYTITRTPYPVIPFLVTDWDGIVPEFNKADNEPLQWFYLDEVLESNTIPSVVEIVRTLLP